MCNIVPIIAKDIERGNAANKPPENWEEIQERLKHTNSFINLKELSEAERETLRERRRAAYRKKNFGKDGYLGGVKQTKPMSWSKADNNAPNPHFNDTNAREKGYRTNCQTCVISFEARLRGYNVQALPNKDNAYIKQLSRNTSLAWIDPKTKQQPEYIKGDGLKNAKQALNWLNEKVEKDKRYSFEFAWSGKNTGHIIIMTKTKSGVLQIYDPQSNKTITNETGAFYDYLQRLAYPIKNFGRSPKLLPISELDFNKNFVDNILRRGT